MATAAERLQTPLRVERPDREEIADQLDRMSVGERLEAIRSLGGVPVQARLWEAAADAPVVALADLVPPDMPPLREVIWHGKNSLPAFTLFQKRFCRPLPGTVPEQLWGYNHTTIAWLVGPGYFVVHREGDAPAAIDYRQVPPSHPASWPAIKSNGAGASYFVYRDMVDYLRRVSQHVLIGRATRHGIERPNYFILCREG
jgi:hypothetical protein